MASELPQDTVTPPPTSGMIGRIQRLLLSPKTEWAAIDAEPMTVQGILMTWVLPLAAIGPIAKVIGSLLFWGVGWFVASVVTGVLAYIVAVGSTWLLALIIDALAPNFGGTKNPVQAMKVAAFSSTAYYLSGIFQIVWFLAPLAIVGLYSLYLLWVGQPILMRVTEDKAPGYVIVTILIDIVIVAVAVSVVAAITAAMFFAAVVSPLDTLR